MSSHDGAERELHESVRIVVRPLGSALPLGFFVFGIGMTVYGGLGIGWIPSADQNAAGILLAAFVFPLELVATVMAFLTRDTGGATGLGVFSTSWLASGLVLVTGKPGTLSAAFGLFLVAFGVAVLLLAIPTALGKPLVAGLLLLGGARSFLGGAYELGAGRGVDEAGGVVAFVLCAFAFYGGLALLLEDLHQREVLPLGRIGASRSAFEDDLAAQLDHLEREAGVRQAL